MANLKVNENYTEVLFSVSVKEFTSTQENIYFYCLRMCALMLITGNITPYYSGQFAWIDWRHFCSEITVRSLTPCYTVLHTC